ncbi:MAG: NUDIX hydrolase [Tepidisphaera sp.]
MSNGQLRTMTEIARTTLHKGKKYDFERITLRTARGTEIHRECVRHPGAVVILPILVKLDGTRSVVFVRNERFSIGRDLLELPAGTREPGEDPALTAGRELIEETGYQAATLTPLTRFYTTPGMTDELMWAYVASGLSFVGQALEEDEVLVAEELPVEEAVRRAHAGGFEDGKTILTLLLARARGLI